MWSAPSAAAAETPAAHRSPPRSQQRTPALTLPRHGRDCRRSSPPAQCRWFCKAEPKALPGYFPQPPVLSENPFTVAKDIIEEIKHAVDIIIVDFHAEATAEKIALSYYLDGDVTVVYGTHTHVQTADETILEKGTGYITDIGMTGPKKSVIGMDVEASIKRFETSLPEKYKIAEGKAKFNSCMFEIDDITNKVKSITRINA